MGDAKDCPRCRLVNPPDAQRCDCGYDFVARRVERPYAGAAVAHRGGTILALGIASLLFCGIIFGPMAMLMGRSDLRAMADGRMDPSGRGLTQAGQICGTIATLLTLAWLGIVGYIFLGK